MIKIGASNSPYMYEKLGEPLIKDIVGKVTTDTLAPIIAMTYRGMHDYKRAIEGYKRVVQARPNDGVAYYYLGDCCRLTNDFNNALKFFKIAYNLGQWKPYTANMIAEVYVSINNEDEALDWLSKAIEDGLDKENIKTNPAFKKIENNERFIKLVSN